MDTKQVVNEGVLIQSSIEGDGKAFETLYLHYMDAIFRYIFFRVGDELLAEDMTEEVFVRAWEALPKYKHGKYPFSSWLYRIAHNLIVDHYRKRQPLPMSDAMLSFQSNPEESLEGIIHRKQEMEMLAKSMKKLGELEQQIIILRFIEGLSHKEIASIVGKSQAACRVILHRALKSLRAILVGMEGYT